jgi:hypothetical protein
MAVAISIGVALICTVLSLTVFRTNKALQIAMSAGVYVSLISATITLVDANIRAKEIPNNSAVQRLDTYEAYLSNPTRLESKDNWYKVGLMGDSTFVSQKNLNDIMPKMLEQTLRVTRKQELETQYIHFAGLDAFSFYQLVNRMIEDDVQLIVIPVNLRSFGQAWMQKTPNFITMMNSYVPLTDFPFLFWQGSKSDIHMSHVLLDKLDASMFDRRYHRLLYKSVSEYRTWENEQTVFFEDYFTAHPEKHKKKRTFALFRMTNPKKVTEHHPYIAMFQRINVLAAENDTKVLYYTVQVNPGMIVPGVFQPGPMFDTCRELFGTGENIYFEDITDVVPKEHFDNFSHLTKPGLQMVAESLADKIIAIKNEDANTPAN